MQCPTNVLCTYPITADSFGPKKASVTSPFVSLRLESQNPTRIVAVVGLELKAVVMMAVPGVAVVLSRELELELERETTT
jgi:hypothetical protein